ncbi:hypothetical protein FM106_14420 [Brachybacterium faecium]|nr:hypothetical protein FM106_14420 [Brachybacterium faecium]
MLSITQAYFFHYAPLILVSLNFLFEKCAISHIIIYRFLIYYK